MDFARAKAHEIMEAPDLALLYTKYDKFTTNEKLKLQNYMPPTILPFCPKQRMAKTYERFCQ